MNSKLQDATPEWAMACKAGLSALEPLMLMRTVAEKHLEWDQYLFIAKLDLKQAFESLPLPVAQVILERSGAEASVIDAYLKELLTMNIDL
eukprot:14239407-Heterocapsa_arctica.AAC.1